MKPDKDADTYHRLGALHTDDEGLGTDQDEYNKVTSNKIEENYDDCGDNVTSIEMSDDDEKVEQYMDYEVQDDEGEWDSIYASLFDPIFLVHNFLGSGNDGHEATTTPEAINYDNSHDMVNDMQNYLTWGSSLEIVEICGGKAGVMRFCIRKQYVQSGRKFDLSTGVDLAKPRDAQALIDYVEANKPIIV
eukprot:5526585-Heterocapsa_arctica.AAC.1